MIVGPMVRNIPSLRALMRQGGRLVKRESWQLCQANGWREWAVQIEGWEYPVSPRIAVTAHRKGLVTYEAEVQA